MPALAGAAEMISEKLPEAQFVISKHPDKSVSAYDAALNGASFRYVVAEGDLHNIVGASDFAIVASGTATLETAMIGTPFIVVYKASLLTYILYKIVADIPYLCLANIIAGKEIVPELLQFNMTAGKIASRAVGLISDSSSLSSMRENLAAVKASLGAPGASKRAALAIIKLLS
jgi:lipid-A-disaccharide synthase